MPKLPRKTLDELKCCKCNGFLSVAPIIPVKEDKNMCGRCAKKIENLSPLRNKVYEKIAERYIFPCKYVLAGCKEEMLFNIIENHEEHCYYQPVKCPLIACPWKNTVKKMKFHFQEKHHEQLVNHPYMFRWNQNYKKTYVLFEAHDFLFVLEMKEKLINQTKLIKITVRAMGKPINCEFMFSVELGEEDIHKSFIQKQKVLDMFEKLDEDKIITIDSNCLSNIINFSKSSVFVECKIEKVIIPNLISPKQEPTDNDH